MTAAMTTVTVIDRDADLTAGDLARACHAETAWVAELVEVGIVRARRGDRPADWAFHGEDLLRARQARRLQRDFGVELDAAALMLDLMEEVRRLKARLRAMGME